MQNSSEKCCHHPIKYHSAPAKVLLYIFRREYALNFFRCQICNIMLNPPRIYFNVVLRLCYFFFSATITILLLNNVRLGGVFSQFPAIISLSFLFLAIYFFYRLVSSLLLAFGKWEPDQPESCASTRMHDLLSYNRRIGSIMITGMFLAQLIFRDQQQPLFIFIGSIVLTALGLFEKRKGYIITGVALLVYSIFPLFLLHELAAQFKNFNCAFATLLAVVVVVSE